MAEVELFVIGGGSGGVACARRSASHGARVALAEHSRVGGTCVIRGCVPKKLMSYGAHFAEAFRAARSYGWTLDEPRLDFERLCQARNHEIKRLNQIYINMLEKSGVRLIDGTARIAGRDGDGFIIAVAGERVTARRVLIAVGGTPHVLDLPGIQDAVTSDQILEDVYPQPKRIAVVGAGYIGVELASILQHLGSEATLVFRGDVPLRGFDDELRRELTGQLELHGLKLRARTLPQAIERTAQGLRLSTSTGPIDVDMVMMATGRKPTPNTARLGLDALGVAMDDEGAVRVDETYQSNVPGILAVGDCSNHAGHGLDAAQYDLTPIAIVEGRAVAERLFNDNPQTVNYATVPTAIFSLPQASTAGMSEARARELGHKVRIFKTKFRPMLHTLTGGEDRVFMKLVVDRDTDKVLGCHIVGAEAAEIIQGFAAAMTCGATKAQLDATVALHPSTAEELVLMSQAASE